LHYIHTIYPVSYRGYKKLKQGFECTPSLHLSFLLPALLFKLSDGNYQLEQVVGTSKAGTGNVWLYEYAKALFAPLALSRATPSLILTEDVTR